MRILVLAALLFGFFSSKASAKFSVKKVVVASSKTCALSTEGELKCWGLNDQGQLGTGDKVYYGSVPATMGSHLPTINIGSGLKIADVCASDSNICAATTDGRVKCWSTLEDMASKQMFAAVFGHGSQVAQGMGDGLPFTNLGSGFVAKAVSCGGFSYNCALSKDGQIKCWGANFFGQFAIGDIGLLFTGVSDDVMGNNLRSVPAAEPYQALSSGIRHNCATTASAVRCWGANQMGQLGQEDTEYYGGKPESGGYKTPPIRLESQNGALILLKVTTGAAGNERANTDSDYSCALYKVASGPNKLKCWGENATGLLGIGSVKSYGATADSMGSFLPEIRFGDDEVVDVEIYSEFSCALTRSGKVRCWGRNNFGQLGQGDNGFRGNLPANSGINIPAIDLALPAKALSVGNSSSHVCAILVNSEMKCWGDNRHGELGYEDQTNRGESLEQMGEYLPFVAL